MCTVTWGYGNGGFQILANRDERHTRKPAHPPAIRTVHGVRIAAPTDGDFGGTWIGVNEFGLALCLLNLYQGLPVASDGSISRGVLVFSLLNAAGTGEVHERISRTNLRHYQPFTLLALAPGEPASVLEWNGQSVGYERFGDRRRPLISSGYDLEGVVASRRALFRATVGDEDGTDPDALRRFHQSHHPERGAYSPCMHRDDARTVSFSRVDVSDGTATIEYSHGSPCQSDSVSSVWLQLRASRKRF